MVQFITPLIAVRNVNGRAQNASLYNLLYALCFNGTVHPAEFKFFGRPQSEQMTAEHKPIYFWTGTITRQSRLARALIRLAMWIDGAPVLKLNGRKSVSLDLEEYQ